MAYMPLNAKSNASQDLRTAPYIPFATFISALDRLGPDADKVPEIIDRSMFDSFSGAVQSQVIATFRFLNLIDGQNRVTEELADLVGLPAQRKTILRPVLEASYSDVFAIGLHKASAKQLDEAMERYNVYGATLRKAVSFFCKAAQFTDVPLSPFITRRKGKGGRRRNGRTRTATGLDGATGNDSLAESLEATPVQKHSKTLKLETGEAEVTISVRFDPFSTSEFDRNYIFKLVDTLSNYKPPQPQPSAPPKAKGAAVSIIEEDPYGGMGVTDDDVPF
jgi:hypothetical protein